MGYKQTHVDDAVRVVGWSESDVSSSYYFISVCVHIADNSSLISPSMRLSAGDGRSVELSQSSGVRIVMLVVCCDVSRHVQILVW